MKSNDHDAHRLALASIAALVEFSKKQKLRRLLVRFVLVFFGWGSS